MKEPVQPFDWERILIDQFPLMFLAEVAFRTVFMFIVLLVTLMASGKREVRQLSIYELILVIGLGSAAGDPMFYDDVPLSAAVVVFAVMLGCYKTATFISDRNPKIHDIIEGKAVYIIENGCILIDNFDREDLTMDELLSDLRQAGIEQLGQIKTAIREPNGQLSVFQFAPNEAKPGMPVLPKAFDQRADHVDQPGQYACCTCGLVKSFDAPAQQPSCPTCNQSVWVAAAR